MTHIRKRMPQLSRRGFVVGSAAAVGGLSLGFHVPGASATEAVPEINAWVLIKPDETVVFSWIVFKSRAHRDRVNAKVMKDKRMDAMMGKDSMPFDLKRMVYGGFEVMVDA